MPPRHELPHATPASRSARRLRRRAGTAFTMLGVLAVGQVAVVRRHLARLDGAAATTNALGRQRMLSQRLGLALHAAVTAAGDPTASAASRRWSAVLADDAPGWSANQQRLAVAALVRGTPVQARLAAVAPTQAAMAAALADARARLARGDAAGARAALAAYLSREDDYLAAMDGAVAALAATADARQRAALRAAILLCGITLGALAGLYAFSVRPAGRSLEAAQREAEAAHAALGLAHGEVTEQNDFLQAQAVELELQQDELNLQGAALRDSEARHRLLFDSSPLPMWVYDLATLRFLAINQAAVVQYGWTRDEFLGMSLPDIRPPEDADALVADVALAPRRLKQASEWRHRTKAGRMLDVVITSHPIAFDGRDARLVLATDVTERKAAEAALRRSEARYRALAQHASDVTLVVALEAGKAARVRDVSPSVRGQYGHAPEALLGRPLTDVLHPDDAESVEHALAALRTRPGAPATLRHRVRRVDGAWRQAETIAVDLADEPAVGGVVLTTRDVTERAALEAELAHQAYHDALTGLPNRSQLRREVDRALTAADEAGRDPATVAVLLLDLDGFKRVNDSAGHAAGDALLVQVGERLRHATRGCDLVARLGGDEFAVLLADVHAQTDLATIAGRVVSALARPFTVHDTSCVVGASVGVARGAGPAATVDALLRDADLALYEAKARGKGQHAFFDPDMHVAAVERVALEAALRAGLERGEFRVVYQPIVDLAGGAVVGVEALARWEHPGRGLVSPAVFIPVAEETGLIVPLGRWVLEAACRQAAAWQPAGGGSEGAVQVAVNVSGRQLARPEFVAEVEAALAASGLAPARLTLELTESTVIHQPEVALERLRALKALGVRLAIDDFGTGYSALSYLQQFPIDVLKIDKRFVDRVAEGGQSAALASAIVALGRALSLRTVAEGVERADQHAALAAMGCAHGQGYLFARPLAPEAVGAFLRGAGAPAA